MYRYPSLFRPTCRIRDRPAQLDVKKRSMLSVISGSQVEDFSVSQSPLPCCSPAVAEEGSRPGPLTPPPRPAHLPEPTDDEDGERSTLSSAPSSPNRLAFVRRCNSLKSLLTLPKHDPSRRHSDSKIMMKTNQRWLKLRTTVQLSGALSSASKQKPTLKREDSFITRFSTRQIIEAQDTVEDPVADNEREIGSSDVVSRKRHKRPPWSVINPDETFFFCWLFLLTLCVLYNVWTLIVRQAFPELQRNMQRWWLAGDAFSDFIYLSDILVQLRTGYLEQGLMVYDSRKLARHYMLSRPFVLDLLSVVPLDLLQLVTGVCPMLRFPRFVKVYRTRVYYYMVESRTLFPNVWRVVMLVHVLLLLAHWFGCFYYLLSEAEEFRGDWAYPYGESEEFTTLTRKYLASVYWSTLTLTTIGDLPTPHTNNHTSRHLGGSWPANGSAGRRHYKSRLTQINSSTGYLFTIVSYLIGVFIFATIVGQVGNVITNRNANRLEFERLLDSAKLYMRHHRVPRDMQRRVQRWYDYSWSRGHIQGGGDINAALGLLPDKLRTELALHVNLMTLKKVTIFKACQPEFLHDLVLKMRASIFTPGDLICRKGEVAREMFIIADGILEVISDSGKVLTTMKAGDFFGEIGILNLDGLNKRTADVRSVGYSELFSLSRDNVLSAMRDYPEAQEILQTLGRRRLLEARKASGGRAAAPATSSSMAAAGAVNGTGTESERRVAGRRRPEVIKHVLRRVKRVDSDGDVPGPTSADLLTCSSDERHGGGSEIADSHRRRRSSQRRRKLGTTLTQNSPLPPGTNVADSDSLSVEVIGAGLPLLQRLRLLRDRQVQAPGEDWSERSSKTHHVEPDTPVVPGRRQSSSARACAPVLKLLQGRTDRAESEHVEGVAAYPCLSSGSPRAVSVRSPASVVSVATQTDSPPLGSDSCTSSPAADQQVSESAGDAELAETVSGSPPPRWTDGCADHPVLPLGNAAVPLESPGGTARLSPPGSDTAERRSLRSILRRLGGSAEYAAPPTLPPTVQGYLARKKNLIKSVSFNQHSPPNSPTDARQTLPHVTSQATPQLVVGHSPSLDLVAEIRSLLEEKLMEMHVSLSDRMESLENKLKERDRLLHELCSRQQCQELMQPDQLWKLEFRSRNREHTVVEVERASDSELPTPVPSTSTGTEPDEWEVQMLVEEIACSERQQRRSLVPELTFSELELLGRLEGTMQPARADVGRMASTEAVHVAGRPGKRLGRIASLREGSGPRSAGQVGREGGLRRPLLQQSATMDDSSRDSSPSNSRHTGHSKSRQEMETAAL